MKLVLNILLILIAVSSFILSISQSYSIVLKYISLATSIACVSATLNVPKHRYILAGIALILLLISYIYQYLFCL